MAAILDLWKLDVLPPTGFEGILLCFSIADSEPIVKKVITFAICGGSLPILTELLRERYWVILHIYHILGGFRLESIWSKLIQI